MAINQISAGIQFKYQNITSLKKWISGVLKVEKCRVGDITIVFCSDDYLLEVNKTYLSHDYYTDVITFDYSEGYKISGDIMISVDRVVENSKIYSVDFINELDRVIIHGILHLIGYSDYDYQSKYQMKQKEDYFLSKR
ncbi:MAG: rRNA maturation RNase YbeY [Cyclobacteriaceae bacterium]